MDAADCRDFIGGRGGDNKVHTRSKKEECGKKTHDITELDRQTNYKHVQCMDRYEKYNVMMN